MTHPFLKRFSVVFLALIFCAGVQMGATQNAHAQDANLSAAGSSNNALDKQFGIGVALGTVIGPALQIRLGEASAIDIVLGGSWNRGRHFHFHAQYIYKFNLGDWDVGRLALHVGGGIEYSHYRWGRNRIVSNDDFYGGYWGGGLWGIGRMKPPAKYRHWLGIRVPVGVSFTFKKAPFDVYTEFAPGMYFIHKPDFSWTYTIGGRYWF